MLINLFETHTKYINLDSDIDKNLKMQELLQDFTKYERVEAVYLEHDKILALTKSHKKALQDLDTPGIVLEDDCVFFKKERYIDVPNDADIVFLGIWEANRPVFRNGPLIPPYEEVNESLVRVYSMLGSHAIMYTSEKGKAVALEAYELAIRTEAWNDVMLNRVLPYIKAYAPKKPVFAQTSMYKESAIEYSCFERQENDFYTPKPFTIDTYL